MLLFQCPVCGSPMALPACSCGYAAPFAHGVYQLTDDPYLVKDDTAAVKYIGYEEIGEAFSGSALFEKPVLNEKYRRMAELVGGGILLDLACGDGMYTVPLLQCGVKIVAMDISDKMLSLLYKRAMHTGVDLSGLTVCRANALHIPLVDGAVDAVIANSMLHLISKPELVIKEIHRVLKPGGRYLTCEDKPGTERYNTKKALSDQERAENERFSELQGFVHRRYFEILQKEYGIAGTRYSWQFDRETFCNDLFSSRESYLIPMHHKIKNRFEDTFLERMRKKGFSDQSDVPPEVHETVFPRVMRELTETYGADALRTVYTGYENDVEIIVYSK